MKKVLILSAILLIAYAIACWSLHRQIDKWDWSQIDVNATEFPEDFIWGTASASFQVEGGHDDTDSWGWWESQVDQEGHKRVLEGAGICNNEWELYPQDIANMKWLGVDSYRFSVSWSKIMPAPDSISEEALQHYDDLIDSLLHHDITPMITFHHFSHPMWFERMGAFDDEANVPHFVNFVSTCFERFGDRVQLYATFNEPVVHGYGRHLDKNHPHLSDEISVQSLGIMMRNVLIAHDRAYDKIKSMPYGKQAQVGIVKSFMQMDPASSYDLGDLIIAHYANKIFLDAMVNYFTEGTFDFQAPPVGADVTLEREGPARLDFIGLNYYSHNAFDFQYGNLDIDKASKPLVYPGEIATDMDYGYYAEGLYRAIRECSEINKPIYITENGIGLGPEREELRKEHLRTTIYDVSKAIQDGYDVRAYYYWSLNDNFEWDFGFSKNFGLFSVDRKGDLSRTPKETAQLYREIIARHD